MKVSVIIPAFNIQDYIERCLLSVINQSLKDIEIIVVDDGSTDNTANIIKNISKIDNRIKFIKKNNGGVNSARKIGLEKAIGEYILFIDGDDWIETECLEKVYKSAKKNCSDIVMFNVYESYSKKKIKIKSYKDEVENKELIKQLFLTDIMPSIWFKVIRRRFLLDNNIKIPVHIEYAEDLAISATIFLNNPKVSLVSDNLYNYFQRDNSVTQSITRKILDIDKAMDFIENYLIDKKLLDKYIKEFEFLIYKHMFLDRVIKYEKYNSINREMYIKFKKRKINIYKNEYILNDINNANFISKFRSRIYYKNYNLGIIFDYIRVNIKKIL